MVSPEHTPLHLQTPTMATKSTVRSKPSFLSDGLLCAGGALVALLLIWALWSFIDPNTNNPSTNFVSKPTITTVPLNCAHSTAQDSSNTLQQDPETPSFYDDPNITYTIEKPISNWDQKRRQWMNQHPSIDITRERVILVTGSQSNPCRNPIGDHLLLRFFKNKVDYCRIHGYDIFYNNVLLNPKMFTFWAKIPAVRAAMIAHPEAEWVWWVDSDAAITDMEFRLPLAKYKHHNLIVHGWENLIYDTKSWVSLNAGVFLIRNCQWSMDFMDTWASFGPQTENYEQWGKTLKSVFKDKLFNESDDQSALVYLLLKEKEKWGAKIYVESEYYFEGYWVEIVGTLENITHRYVEMERGVRRLRRRRAEKTSEYYGEVREEFLKEFGSLRRPFITHFTGCQPCSGVHNEMYSGESCWDGMMRALNFADNQVLRSFGFVHQDLVDSSKVSPLPFDYPT
eukprot:TRINITY_DN15052_c0_g1_i1.p1 TRINITY_DN15052_c0_g1~~TRINITY_DN15052_c0_g1_i1.p1  ORF type:complete len:453 (+),score=25.29 TRINITY_DN15052_c0_g1_i1:79-1437(+)